ncbi:MAG: hypothetical protein HY553_17355 [Elusimicrobia bacterium]|nr:hypothetical protein [Elusimicrobiota bacterium]
MVRALLVLSAAWCAAAEAPSAPIPAAPTAAEVDAALQAFAKDCVARAPLPGAPQDPATPETDRCPAARARACDAARRRLAAIEAQGPRGEAAEAGRLKALASSPVCAGANPPSEEPAPEGDGRPEEPGSAPAARWPAPRLDLGSLAPPGTLRDAVNGGDVFDGAFGGRRALFTGAPDGVVNAPLAGATVDGSRAPAGYRTGGLGPVERNAPPRPYAVMKAAPAPAPSWGARAMDWGWWAGKNAVHSVGAVISAVLVEPPATVLQGMVGAGRLASGYLKSDREEAERARVEGAAMLAHLPGRVANAVTRPVAVWFGTELLGTGKDAVYGKGVGTVATWFMDDRSPERVGAVRELSARAATLSSLGDGYIDEAAHGPDASRGRKLLAGYTVKISDTVSGLLGVGGAGKLFGAKAHAAGLTSMAVGAGETIHRDYGRWKDARNVEDSDAAWHQGASDLLQLGLIGGATARSMRRARGQAAGAEGRRRPGPPLLEQAPIEMVKGPDGIWRAAAEAPRGTPESLPPPADTPPLLPPWTVHAPVKHPAYRRRSSEPFPVDQMHPMHGGPEGTLQRIHDGVIHDLTPSSVGRLAEPSLGHNYVIYEDNGRIGMTVGRIEPGPAGDPANTRELGVKHGLLAQGRRVLFAGRASLEPGSGRVVLDFESGTFGNPWTPEPASPGGRRRVPNPGFEPNPTNARLLAAYARQILEREVTVVDHRDAARPAVYESGLGQSADNSATARRRRLDRLVASAPPQAVHQGRRYDVEGMTPDGRVRLEPSGARDVFYPLEDMVGTRVLWHGMERKVVAASREDQTLRFSNGDTVPAKSLIALEQGDAPIFIHRDRARVITAVDSDGAARLSALRADGEQGPLEVPIERLGSVPVRLKGRETEGLFTLSRTNDGRLIAERTGPDGRRVSLAVTPEAVAGRHVELHSPEFGPIAVDSFRDGVSRETTGAGKALGRDFGSLSGGRTLVATGDKVTEQMIRSVERETGPLTFNLFELEVSNRGRTTPAGRLVDALIDHAVGGSPGRSPQPVRIVYNPVRPLDPSVVARIEAARKGGADIELVVPGHIADGTPTVVHAKTFASERSGYLMTGGLSKDPGSKVEIGVALPPEAATALHEYHGLLAAPGSNSARRLEVARRLAGLGVLVNDPKLTDGAFVTRAMNGLFNGAGESLDVYVKELKDVDATRTLIDRARDGVKVDIVVRKDEGIDPRARELVEQALAEDPSLPLSLRVYPTGQGPLPHGNLIVADGDHAYVGTSFPWSSHLKRVMPGGRSFENGVLLEGDDAEAVRRQFREAVPEPVSARKAIQAAPDLMRGLGARGPLSARLAESEAANEKVEKLKFMLGGRLRSMREAAERGLPERSEDPAVDGDAELVRRLAERTKLPPGEVVRRLEAALEGSEIGVARPLSVRVNGEVHSPAGRHVDGKITLDHDSLMRTPSLAAQWVLMHELGHAAFGPAEEVPFTAHGAGWKVTQEELARRGMRYDLSEIGPAPLREGDPGVMGILDAGAVAVGSGRRDALGSLLAAADYPGHQPGGENWALIADNEAALRRDAARLPLSFNTDGSLGPAAPDVRLGERIGIGATGPVHRATWGDRTLAVQVHANLPRGVASKAAAEKSWGAGKVNDIERGMAPFTEALDLHGRMATASELLSGAPLDQVPPGTFIQPDAVISVGRVLEGLRKRGLGLADPELFVLDKDQPVGGVMRRKGDVVFIDVDLTRDATMMRDPQFIVDWLRGVARRKPSGEVR